MVAFPIHYLLANGLYARGNFPWVSRVTNWEIEVTRARSEALRNVRKFRSGAASLATTVDKHTLSAHSGVTTRLVAGLAFRADGRWLLLRDGRNFVQNG